MVLPEEVINEITRKLLEAEANQQPIEPLTSTYPGITVEDARKINLRILGERLRRGERLIGYKVAFTNKAMQQAFGVDRPEFGPLTSGMLVPDGGVIKFSELIQPRAEAEIAFVLRDDLKGPGVTVADVLRATEGVMPALEIVDSRIKGKHRIEDFIADSSHACRVVLGGKLVDVKGVDLRLIGVVVEVNGEIAATAAGAAALGNPTHSVAWLANALAGVGECLKAGQVVITGSLISAIPLKAGDYIKATFDRLGHVSVKFM